MNPEQKRLNHRRLPDFETFDKITIERVPRLKTSGLSGDEWRMGVEVKLWFKGMPVHEAFLNSWNYAVATIGGVVAEHESPLPDRVLEIEEGACDQPSCPAKAVSKYKLKRLFSDRGEALHPDEGSHADYYRQFCQRHLYRGDCSREDRDDNYEVIEGPGPNDSQEQPGDESPSGHVTVTVDSIDEIPAAVEAVRKQLPR